MRSGERRPQQGKILRRPPCGQGSGDTHHEKSATPGKSSKTHLANIVEGQGNSAVGSRARTVLATEEELKLGSTWAVGDTDCAGELDEIGGRDARVLRDETLLERYNLVSTTVGRELRLDVAKKYEGAVGAVTVAMSTRKWEEIWRRLPEG